MKSFTSAIEGVIDDADGVAEDEKYVEFELDGRVLRAYQPTEGQLTFMMASLGRGQSTTSRFASIINLMMESLRSSDKDYFEGRLLSRDLRTRLSVKTVESIFEFLMEEWFATPTGEPSTSAASQS